MLVSAIVLKQFNFPNSQIAFYTSLFILPWVLKFLFTVFLEHISSKRTLTIFFQYTLAIITFLIAILIHFNLIKIVILSFFIMGLIASLHDITADGFYLVSLNRSQQINFIPVRTLAFQGARLFSQGGIVIAVGFLQAYLLLHQAWTVGFLFLVFIILMIAFYHQFQLPQVLNNISEAKDSRIVSVFYEFFKQPNILKIILFLLIYNCAEAQLIKIVPLFLLEPRSSGGLQMSLDQVGWIYGTLGMLAMLGGVFLSSRLINRIGLKKSLQWVTGLLLLSHLGYLFISSNIDLLKIWVMIVIIIAQLCYGLTNNAYMVYLLDNAREHRYSMSFYAIYTGIMALGMMIPGALSGYLQHYLGYFNFFIWIILLQLLVIIFTFFIFKNHEHSNSGAAA